MARSLVASKGERGRALLPSQSGRDKRDWRGEWREGRQKREEIIQDTSRGYKTQQYLYIVNDKMDVFKQ